jgi:hypothetical protein
LCNTLKAVSFEKASHYFSEGLGEGVINIPQQLSANSWYTSSVVAMLYLAKYFNSDGVSLPVLLRLYILLYLIFYISSLWFVGDSGHGNACSYIRYSKLHMLMLYQTLLVIFNTLILMWD